MEMLVEWSVLSDIAISILLFIACISLKDTLNNMALKGLKSFTFFFTWFSVSKAFYITTRFTFLGGESSTAALIMFSFISLIIVSILSFLVFTD